MKGTIKDFGYANGWIKTPRVVKRCKKRKHEIIDKMIGNCEHKVICLKCGYTYKYDSS